MANDQEMKLKSEKHQALSLEKKKSGKKQDDKVQMGPIVLGVFLFVVIGSALFQILNVGGRGQSDILI